MAIEPERACGFRKIGGIYLVAEKCGPPCKLLPWELTTCVCCGQGFKQCRGMTSIGKPDVLFSRQLLMQAIPDLDRPIPILGPQLRTYQEARPEYRCDDVLSCNTCPIRDPEILRALEIKTVLVWVGAKFYPTAKHFIEEARSIGISKRIPCLPKDFVPGKTLVLLAHPKAVPQASGPKSETTKLSGGIFATFMPQRVEMIITESQSKDKKFIGSLVKRNITPVIVPDDDKDHR